MRLSKRWKNCPENTSCSLGSVQHPVSPLSLHWAKLPFNDIHQTITQMICKFSWYICQTSHKSGKCTSYSLRKPKLGCTFTTRERDFRKRFFHPSLNQPEGTAANVGEIDFWRLEWIMIAFRNKSLMIHEFPFRCAGWLEAERSERCFNLIRASPTMDENLYQRERFYCFRNTLLGSLSGCHQKYPLDLK